jgi:hypothetical protein
MNQLGKAFYPFGIGTVFTNELGTRFYCEWETPEAVGFLATHKGETQHVHFDWDVWNRLEMGGKKV